MEDFFLDLVYKNKKVRFRVVNPEAPIGTLMSNLRHAIGSDGRLIFDFPSIDETGAPLDYFFGVEDPQVHEIRVLRPRIGRADQTLADYNVHSGDTLFLVPDPFPG
ncbi:MAG: hypothetical protein IK045_04160 [Bacteroidales bacterium]|nr:hypothetical protein [Bacteroidales bacterium]